jgi:hypothetical protein
MYKIWVTLSTAANSPPSSATSVPALRSSPPVNGFFVALSLKSGVKLAIVMQIRPKNEHLPR